MRRGLYKTEAVVLSSINFGESDRILAFYTLDHGKVRGIAKGALRSRKRFVGNNLEPLTHARVGFFLSEKTELARVEESSIIEGFPGLRADIRRMAGAQYLLELTNEMTREGLSMPSVFRLLLSFLRMLDSGADEAASTRFFEIKLLTLLGFLPHLEGCVSCKDPFDGEGLYTVFFSVEKGGAVCPSCSARAGAGDMLPLTLGTARTLSAAVRLGEDKLSRLRPDPSFLREGSALLDAFIRHQIGKELKTKVFLDKLRRKAV